MIQISSKTKVYQEVIMAGDANVFSNEIEAGNNEVTVEKLLSLIEQAKNLLHTMSQPATSIVIISQLLEAHGNVEDEDIKTINTQALQLQTTMRQLQTLLNEY